MKLTLDIEIKEDGKVITSVRENKPVEITVNISGKKVAADVIKEISKLQRVKGHAVR